MKRPNSLDSTLLRIELLKRGISLRQFASRCGVSWAAIRIQLSRGFTASNKLLRYRLEDGLGYPLWSTALEWKRRKALAAAVGFDPYFATRMQLRKFCVSRGMPWNANGRQLKRAELLQTIASRVLQPAALASLTNTHTQPKPQTP